MSRRQDTSAGRRVVDIAAEVLEHSRTNTDHRTIPAVPAAGGQTGEAMSVLAHRWELDEKRFRWLFPEQAADPGRVVRDEATGFWTVHGHADALRVLNTPEVFSAETGRLIPERREFDEGTITQLDPPRHTALRGLFSHAFTPRAVTGLIPRVEQITADLLDPVADTGRFDLMTDFAYPLPITVISEMLGVPAQDRPRINAWVDRLLSGTTEYSLISQEDGQDELSMVLGAARSITDYLRELVRARRDDPRDDMLTALMRAEVDGVRLTENEVVNFANTVLVAGHITATLLIGSAVLLLDAYPDLMSAVREDRSLVPGLLEESLRWLPPIASMVRVTNTEVEIGGARIGRDEMVCVWIPSVNRDPAVFDSPYRFDLRRPTNPHLSFGRGAHFCIGAALARHEARVAVDALLDRFPHMACDPDDPPKFVSSPNLVGVTRLPVRTAGGDV